jgi:hypothetical protein
MNWKECGRRRSRPDFRRYPSISGGAEEECDNFN